MHWKRFAVAALAGSVLASSAGCASRLSDAEVVAQNAPAGGQVVAAGPVSDPTATGAIDTGTVPAAQPGTVAVPGAQATPKAGAGGVKAPSGSGTAPAAGGVNAAQPPAVGTPVNVGQIGLFSGILGQILGSAKQGTQAAVAAINASGGLNGHKVNLIVVDDGGDPSAGLAAARKMIEQDKVIAFLNMLSPLNSGSVMPFINERKVPMIGGIGLEPETYKLPFAFPGAASPRVQALTAAKSTIDSGAKKIGLVFCAEFALLCSAVAASMKEAVPQLGGQIVFSQQVSLAQPDFTSQCLSAKQAGVDGLLLNVDPSSVVRFADSCAAQGFKPKYFAPGVIFAEAMGKTTSTDQMIGGASAFPFSFEGAETAEFRKTYQDVIGSAPSTNIQSAVWVGGMILREAGRALPAVPTPADVVKGLHAIKANKFGGLTPGPITFKPGSGTPSTPCAYIVQLNNKAIVAPNGLKPLCLDPKIANG